MAKVENPTRGFIKIIGEDQPIEAMIHYLVNKGGKRLSATVILKSEAQSPVPGASHIADVLEELSGILQNEIERRAHFESDDIL